MRLNGCAVDVAVSRFGKSICAAVAELNGTLLVSLTLGSDSATGTNGEPDVDANRPATPDTPLLF